MEKKLSYDSKTEEEAKKEPKIINLKEFKKKKVVEFVLKNSKSFLTPTKN